MTGSSRAVEERLFDGTETDRRVPTISEDCPTGLGNRRC
jgi:hypothetical protein